MNLDSLPIYTWLAGAVLIALLEWLFSSKLPDSRLMLKNHLLMVVLFVVAKSATIGFTSMSMPKSAAMADLAGALIIGILMIRLLGLLLFRLLLPAVGVRAPRILEDIALIVSCLAWGLVELRYAGLNLSSLVTTSAVITGIVAFSMQETLGNLLGGLALQLDNSVCIGDWIKMDGIQGKVIEVRWRYTAVLTNNGDVLVVPNSVLMKSRVDVVSSAERPHVRRWVYFPVGFHIPPQDVIAAIEEAVTSAEIPHIAPVPAPQCVVMDYKDGSTQYALRYWLTTPLHDDTTDSQVRVHIYTALQRHGYTLGRPCMDTQITTDNAERQAALNTENLQRRLQAIDKVDLFSSLDDDERHLMAQALRHTPFARGAVMTRQGAVAHWLYLLVQGEADVWFESAGQERRHLSTLLAGSVFGEMGLMTGQPRKATVLARTNAVCYRLDKDSFEKILQRRPQLADEFASILTQRSQQLVAMEELPQTASMEEQKATILASICHFFSLPL